MNMTKDITLEKAFIDTIEQLQEQGHKPETIRRYQTSWRLLRQYAYKKKSFFYNDKIINQFKKQYVKRNAMSLQRYERLQLGLRVLSEHMNYGSHKSMPPYHKLRKLPKLLQTHLKRFLGFAKNEYNLQESTLKIRRNTIRRFMEFMLRQRDDFSPENIDINDIMNYLKSLSRLSATSRSNTVTSIKQFCQYLFMKGILATKEYEKIPPIVFHQNKNKISLWTREEITAVLNVIDKTTNLGKRNTAIILLACRLGIRCGDITNLKLENIDWRNMTINLVQHKTKNSLCLPLPDDVADAIADYLKNARPKSKQREIFLQVRAPFKAVSNITTTLNNYRQKAGLPRIKWHGLHSMRHTLATNLLESGNSLVVVGGVLGHTAPNSAKRYLSFDLEHLREVAIDPEKEVAHE